MKLSKDEAQLFKESHSKWLKESSFLAKLFLRNVLSNIKNDTDLQKTIANADKELEKSRKKIEKIASGDREKVKQAIPADVRKYLGFDY